MGNINKKFEYLKEKGKAALITYITAGDPNLETTKEIIKILEKNGADIIELGMPFSDPMADGPTIQLASERALKNKITIKDLLDIVKDIRIESYIPIILFGYYNPFLSYGLENFSMDASQAGVDGVLVVDLPPEESGEFKKHTENAGLDLVFLLAPTSTEERIELVAENASGFVYLVSVTGVTGARPGMKVDLEQLTNTIKSETKLPVGIGFGISSPDQVKDIVKYADGVIVGSSIVKIIEKNSNRPIHLLKNLGDFVHSLSEACYTGN